MATERENIEAIRDHFRQIERLMKEEKAKVRDTDPLMANVWFTANAKTETLHGELTFMLFQYFPEFAGDVVISPAFGGR